MFKILYSSMLKGDIADFYLGMIKSAIEKSGHECRLVSGMDDIEKTDIVVTTTVLDALKVIVLKRARFINWYQGIIPEESYLRHKSRVREKIYDILESLTLKYSSLNIFVSHSMLEHYRNKYGYKRDNYFILPCFSTNINRESFMHPAKYSNHIYAYVGGLSKWQCIDTILKVYKIIEEECAEARLKIFTEEIDRAEALAKETGLKSYSIKYVKNDDLPNELTGVKYGFLLREHSPINYVATPTKMSVYMSNGIIPIMSDAIGDFNKAFKDIQNKIIINIEDDCGKTAKSIIEFDNTEVNPEDILNEYEKVFNTYYCREQYENNLNELLLNTFVKK